MSSIDATLFEPLVREASVEGITRPPLSFWTDVWRRFVKHRGAVLGLGILSVMLVMAIIGPWINPHSYDGMQLALKNRPPSAEFWFGTDDLGRDLFTRIWYGARISLFVGFAAAFIDLVMGVIWGGTAGCLGGRADDWMMRFADLLYGLPYLLVVILLMVVMGPGLFTILIAMTLTGWIPMARIVRGQVLQLMTQDYVLASRAMGASFPHILWKHLIPNAMGPILVTVTLTIPTAIFVEAFLSFLGLGVQAPIASWGSMANDGLQALKYYPWRLFLPAFFISVTMLAFNLVGDGLRDALDPRMRQ